MTTLVEKCDLSGKCVSIPNYLPPEEEFTNEVRLKFVCPYASFLAGDVLCELQRCKTCPVFWQILEKESKEKGYSGLQ